MTEWRRDANGLVRCTNEASRDSPGAQQIVGIGAACWMLMEMARRNLGGALETWPMVEL